MERLVDPFGWIAGSWGWASDDGGILFYLAALVVAAAHVIVALVLVVVVVSLIVGLAKTPRAFAAGVRAGYRRDREETR